MNEQILNEALEIAAKLPVWQFIILSGTMKHIQNQYNCFWENKDIKDINEEYHKNLQEFNGAHVKRISWFWNRPEPGPERVPSLLWDARSWPVMIGFAFERIKHNQKHFLEICKMLKNNYYKKIDEFKNDVDKYIKKQISNGDLEQIKTGSKEFQFHYKKPYKDDFKANNIIRKFKYDTKYKPNYKFPTEEQEEFLKNEIIFCSGSLEIKEKSGEPLSKETLDLLENQEFDEMNLENCIEAISHYKLFVSEKDYGRFYKRFKQIEQYSYSLFEDVATEIFIDAIKEFYSYGTMMATNEKQLIIERTKVLQEFEKRFFLIMNGPIETMYKFIDVLGIFYRKGFEFITRNGFFELNCIMRKYNINSTNNWICFDPYWIGEWNSMLNCKEQPDIKLLAYMIYKFFITRSSLMLDALNLCSLNLSYDDLTKEVMKTIRNYKRRIKKQDIYF